MTVWLFTEGVGVEVRASVHRSIQWQGGGLCGSRKIHTPPTEGIGNSGEDGGSRGAKNLKQCMNWNFRRVGGGGGGGGS